MTNAEFIGNWMREAGNVVSGGARKHRHGLHKRYGNLSATWFTAPRISNSNGAYDQWGELESYRARLALLVRDRHTGIFELLLNSQIYSKTTAAHMWETKWALDAETRVKSIGLYEVPLGAECGNGVTHRFHEKVSQFVLDGAKLKLADMRAWKKGTHFTTIEGFMLHTNRMGKQMIGTIERPDMAPTAEKAVSEWQYLMLIADQILAVSDKSKVKNMLNAHLALI